MFNEKTVNWQQSFSSLLYFLFWCIHFFESFQHILMLSKVKCTTAASLFQCNCEDRCARIRLEEGDCEYECLSLNFIETDICIRTHLQVRNNSFKNRRVKTELNMGKFVKNHLEI